MKISLRGWLVVGTFLALMGALVAFAPRLHAADPVRTPAPAAPKGQLTDEALGNLLGAMGLETKQVEQRYDFAFKSNINEEEWILSMSAVLSQDGQSIWIMAWLDELPRSAAAVPRTALLRLLADNDRLGSGKFFAYIASNRRFVLQRVIANNGITSAGFRAALEDLGASVVSTYPHWAVAGWSQAAPEPQSAQTNKTEGIPGTTKSATPAAAPRQAVNESKFQTPVRK